MGFTSYNWITNSKYQQHQKHYSKMLLPETKNQEETISYLQSKSWKQIKIKKSCLPSNYYYLARPLKYTKKIVYKKRRPRRKLKGFLRLQDLDKPKKKARRRKNKRSIWFQNKTKTKTVMQEDEKVFLKSQYKKLKIRYKQAKAEYKKQYIEELLEHIGVEDALLRSMSPKKNKEDYQKKLNLLARLRSKLIQPIKYKKKFNSKQVKKSLKFKAKKLRKFWKKAHKKHQNNQAKPFLIHF